ncbi:MAG: PDZ domain-containing protein, partial [Eubacterium sp.]|nr:PDZ domain-containing protein [Eubacterium sp.]
YFSYGNTSVEGMGYAIPMSTAVTIINDLMDRQVLKDTEKGYLGITGINVSSDMSESYGMPVGVYVKSISDTGAAYKAGIKQGDVITKIDKVTVKTISEVQEKVNNTKVGTTIEVTVMRNEDGQYTEKTVKVTLKSKDTLNGLEDDVTEDDQNTNPYSGNNKDDSYKEIPWGGGLY